MMFWARFATGIAKANSIPVHQSLIADNYPIGIRAHVGRHQHARRPSASSARRRRDRHLGGWRRGMAVGVLRARRPGARGRRRGVLHARAAARPVREAGRARRAHRGRAAGADLDGGGVRGSSASAPSAPCSSPSALGRALQPARAGVAVPRRQPPRQRRARPRPDPQPVGDLRTPVPAHRRSVLRPSVRNDPARALALVGLLILPSALLVPIQFSVESDALLDREDPAVGAHRRRLRDGRAGAAGRRAVPPARHGHRDVDALHLLRRRLHGRADLRVPHRRIRPPRHRHRPRRAQR